jgi:hypothetical protein
VEHREPLACRVLKEFKAIQDFKAFKAIQDFKV